MNLINAAREITPKDVHTFVDHRTIDKKILSELELHSILKKIEKDENIIKIIDGPFEDGVGLWNEDTPRVFKLMVLDGFVEYYDKVYEESRFGIKSLSLQNYYLVLGVVQLIHQELNIKKGNKIEIDVFASNEQIRKGSPSTVVSLYDVKQIKIKALDFLKEINAIENYNHNNRPPSKQYFIISVNRRKFDKIHLELIFSSPNRKTRLIKDGSTLQPIITAKVVEYDDEHGKGTYNNKTKKLFETNTIMSVLTHRAVLADGARINATDIILDIENKRIDTDKELTNKTLTNAKDRVNGKFEQLFGIEDVICYERQQFWLNDLYCSEKSPYKIGK